MHPLPGWEDRATTLLALVVGAAAVHFILMTAVLVGVVAGLGQQLGKLALDALIQDHLAEAVRTSGFARSETLLQLACMLGGIFAVIIPTDATIGMYAAAGLLLAWAVLVVLWNAGRGPDLGRFMPAWIFGGARSDHRTNHDGDAQARWAEPPSTDADSRDTDHTWHDERSWDETRWDGSQGNETRSDTTRWDGDQPDPRVRLRKPAGRSADDDFDPYRKRDH